MNTALYRPSRRWPVWAAFACATGIHIAAIVVAQGKSDKSAAQDFKPAGVDIEVVNKDPEETPPEDASMPPEDGISSRGLWSGFRCRLHTPLPVHLISVEFHGCDILSWAKIDAKRESRDRTKV